MGTKGIIGKRTWRISLSGFRHAYTGIENPWKKESCEKRKIQPGWKKLVVSVAEEGLKLREQALEIPNKDGACIPLDKEEAMELYRILYKLLGGFSA